MSEQTQQQRDEARVRAKWPDAHAWAGHTNGSYHWHVNQSTKDSNPTIGEGATEVEAWADAAARIEDKNGENIAVSGVVRPVDRGVLGSEDTQLVPLTITDDRNSDPLYACWREEFADLTPTPPSSGGAADVELPALEPLERAAKAVHALFPFDWERRSSVPYGDGETVFAGRGQDNHTVVAYPWKHYGMSERVDYFIAAQPKVILTLCDLIRAHAAEKRALEEQISKYKNDCADATASHRVWRKAEEEQRSRAETAERELAEARAQLENATKERDDIREMIEPATLNSEWYKTWQAATKANRESHAVRDGQKREIAALHEQIVGLDSENSSYRERAERAEAALKRKESK